MYSWMVSPTFTVTLPISAGRSFRRVSDVELFHEARLNLYRRERWVNTAVVARVTVSLPDSLPARIDDEAGRRGTTRSALLREAALRELGWPDPVLLEAAVARSRSRFASSGRFDAAALIRAERDTCDRRPV